MLYIREHADQWHIDMDKVAVCGFSAGAYASAMYSVYYNQPIITEFLGIDAEGIHPVSYTHLDVYKRQGHMLINRMRDISTRD